MTINELIDKIVIHSQEKIDGRKYITIAIYFARRYKTTSVTIHAGCSGNYLYFLMGLRLT